MNCSTQCSFETNDTCDTYIQTMIDMNSFNSIEKECNLSKARMNDLSLSEITPKWIRPKRQVRIREFVNFNSDCYILIFDT